MLQSRRGGTGSQSPDREIARERTGEAAAHDESRTSSGVQVETSERGAVKRCTWPFSRPTATRWSLFPQTRISSGTPDPGSDWKGARDALFRGHRRRSNGSGRLVKLERRGANPSRLVLSPDLGLLTLTFVSSRVSKDGEREERTNRLVSRGGHEEAVVCGPAGVPDDTRVRLGGCDWSIACHELTVRRRTSREM